MPFKSKAQERFAFANPQKFGGKKNILEEWMEVTPRNLPEHVKPKKKQTKKEKHGT